MILVAGSANVDFVMRAPRIPLAGETVLGTDFRTYMGGKGANQAVACARAGNASTRMLLAVGTDSFGPAVESSLRSAGVETHVVTVADKATGSAAICVSDDGENAITVCPGANYSLTPSHLPSLAGCTHLLMQLEIPLSTVTAYAQAAKQGNVKVVLNAAPMQPLPAELLQALDVLVLNEIELAQLTGRSGNLHEALGSVDVPCVIVTLGARGCIARVDSRIVEQPGFPITPVDTTGAGDTFCGVLTACLSQGKSVEEAVRTGAAAAALACTRPGAQESIPTHGEVMSFLASRGR